MVVRTTELYSTQALFAPAELSWQQLLIGHVCDCETKMLWPSFGNWLIAGNTRWTVLNSLQGRAGQLQIVAIFILYSFLFNAQHSSVNSFRFTAAPKHR